VKHIIQFSRFGLVGVVATAVHATIGLTLTHQMGVPAFWANLAAFSCALCVSFYGQTRLTFPDRGSDRGAFMRFTAVAVTALGLNQTIVWIVTSILARPYELALAIIVTTVPVFTFAMLKLWALRQ
jgi:putative flippase GtrA